MRWIRFVLAIVITVIPFGLCYIGSVVALLLSEGIRATVGPTGIGATLYRAADRLCDWAGAVDLLGDQIAGNL